MAKTVASMPEHPTPNPRAPFLAAAGALFACGGEAPVETGPDVHASPLMVQAEPPGHEFDGSTIVRLRPMEGMDVEIFYTLDGSPATDEAALRYEGPLELEDTTLLNYIARRAGTWSQPGSELYVAMRPETEVQTAKRTLAADPDSVFFAWKTGDASPMQRTITVRASGVEPVRISSIRLGPTPAGQFFYEPNAFLLRGPEVPRTLQPGESIELALSYLPTSTLRSASIEIRSDSDRDEGRKLIELWGRVSPW